MGEGSPLELRQPPLPHIADKMRQIYAHFRANPAETNQFRTSYNIPELRDDVIRSAAEGWHDAAENNPEVSLGNAVGAAAVFLTILGHTRVEEIPGHATRTVVARAAERFVNEAPKANDVETQLLESEHFKVTNGEIIRTALGNNAFSSNGEKPNLKIVDELPKDLANRMLKNR